MLISMFLIPISTKHKTYQYENMHKNMHINSNTSLPFCQSSTKGSKQTKNKTIMIPIKKYINIVHHDTNISNQESDHIGKPIVGEHIGKLTKF